MTLSAVSAIFVTLIYAGHFTVCKTISSLGKHPNYRVTSHQEVAETRWAPLAQVYEVMSRPWRCCPGPAGGHLCDPALPWLSGAPGGKFEVMPRVDSYGWQLPRSPPLERTLLSLPLGGPAPS